MNYLKIIKDYKFYTQYKNIFASVRRQSFGENEIRGITFFTLSVDNLYIHKQR